MLNITGMISFNLRQNFEAFLDSLSLTPGPGRAVTKPGTSRTPLLREVCA